MAGPRLSLTREYLHRARILDVTTAPIRTAGSRSVAAFPVRQPRARRSRVGRDEGGRRPSVRAVTGARLHPWPVRAMHWTNAVAMTVMIWSGWGIYDDSVIFHGVYFPRGIVLGSWAANSLLWHFAGMWLLMINGATYLVYGFATGRFRRRLLPIRPAEVVRTLRDALRLRLAHDDLTTYNAVQKLLYVVVVLAGIAQVATGLALWKPVQLSSVVALLGGFQGVRLLHFTGMAIIVSFLVVHVALALAVPRTLWFMLSGGPRLRRTGAERQ